MATSQEVLPFVNGWNVVRTLGEGAYGEVKLVVRETEPSHALAMKVIDLDKHPDCAVSVRKEIMILKAVKGHANLIRYVGNREEGRKMFIFLEYADGGELFDQIQPDVGMRTERAQCYFRQLIAGVEFLHGRGIAHRDVKPENLLLCKGVLKVSDMGMATLFRCDGVERLCSTRCGTPPYSAPEVLRGHYRAAPADVWSCGVVLVALLSGELPWDFAGHNCAEFVDWRERTNLDRHPWCKIGNVALSLLRNILQCNVSQRSTIGKIQQHRWFVKDFSKQRAKLSRMNSDNGSGGGARKRHCPLTRIAEESSGCYSQPAPRLVHPLFVDTSLQVPAATAAHASPLTPPMAACSFSQPVSFDQLLVGSQTQDSQPAMNMLQLLVKRMTRFCVSVTAAVAADAIGTACENCGFDLRQSTPGGELTISTTDRRHNELSFKVAIYEMADKVLVDFRRSKGDGLEFKRAFLRLKAKLTPLICNDSVAWLEAKGLVHQGDVDSLSLLSLDAAST